MAILLLLAALLCACATEARIVGSYGGLCVDECQWYDGWWSDYYYCKTTSHNWDYCSPLPETGAYGGVCKADNPCDKQGYKYTWCNTEDGSWDYCTIRQSPLVGSYGGVCIEECKQGDESYTYCKTTKNRWDYCAKESQATAYGNKCKPEHPCGNHWWWYTWCYTQQGSWDYCSLHPQDLTASMTRYGYHCLSECRPHNDYYYCYDWGNWDYCSPHPHSTYKSDRCSSDHSCDKQGWSFYWCNTGTSWDYCSPIENCAYWPNKNLAPSAEDGRKRREIVKVCTLQDQGKRIVTSYTYDTEMKSGIIPPSVQQHREGEVLIGMWDLDSVKGSHQKETLYRTANLRLDLVSIDSSEGIAELHIQTKGSGTLTLAQVFLPTSVQFPLRNIKRAFSESLNKNVVITLRKFPNN